MVSISTGAPTRTLRRVTHPATHTVPSIPLYEVTADRKHRLTICSAAVYSVYVHIVDRRSIPCYGETQCECEHYDRPLKRQHYLYAVAPGSAKVRLLRVTNGLLYIELPKLVEEGLDLRGMVIELSRAFAGKPDSAMLGALIEETGTPPEIGQVPDIAWTVERMLTAPPRLTRWQHRRIAPSSTSSAAATSAEVNQEDLRKATITQVQGRYDMKFLTWDQAVESLMKRGIGPEVLRK